MRFATVKLQAVAGDVTGRTGAGTLYGQTGIFLMRIGCVALAMMVIAAPAMAQTPDGGMNICLEGALAFSTAKYDEALPKLKACTTAGDSVPRFDRAIGFGNYVQLLKMQGKTEERIAGLRKLTAPPYSEWSEFVPPTLAMQKMRESEIYVGMSQAAIILELSAELFDSGKIDEALAENSRAIRVARATRADVMDVEAMAWFSRAVIEQAKGEGSGASVSLVRAYLRGYDHEAIDDILSTQSAATQAKLKGMRETVREHAPKVAYKDAWQASLGKPLDPKDPEIVASVEKLAQVTLDETAMLGAPGL